MNAMLSTVVTNGTGRRAQTADGRPQAGKTGTIDSNAAVWYVGYTPQIAGAAMISIDRTRKPFASGGSRTGLKGYTVPSTGLYLEGSGSGDAGQEIWKPAMQAYLKGRSMQSFNAPPPDLVSRGYADFRNGLPGRDGQDPNNQDPNNQGPNDRGLGGRGPR